MLDFTDLADKDLTCDQEDEIEDKYYGPVPIQWIGEAKKSGAGVAKDVKAAPEPIKGGKMQVLVLPGRQSNVNLAGFQSNNLKRELGKDADLIFLEGDLIWKYRDGVDNHDADPMSVSLSKGLDFKTWFTHTTDDKRDRVDFFKQGDPNVKVTYNKKETDAAVKKLLDFVDSQQVDVICTIFEGSLVVHLAIAKLLSEGKPIPWRMTCFFCPLAVRDDAMAEFYAKGPKVAHPTIHVFGLIDEYRYYQRTAAGRKPPEDYYEGALVLEHSEGHQLPSAQPRAGEIFKLAVEEMKYQCGLVQSQPKKPKNPPKPTSMVLKVLEDMTLRKLRVLCLCGGHSNVPVIKFQTNALKMALGRDAAEFVYIEGTKDWTWYKGEPEPSEMEERIAGGKQLKNWFLDRNHEEGGVETEILGKKAHIATDRINAKKQFDPTTVVEYFDIPEVVESLIDYIYKEGPFDAVVGFSQGAMMMHLLIGYMRKKAIGGREKYPERWKHARNNLDDMPWRISIFFNGMHIRDKRYFDLFDTPMKNHPTVFVYGKEDEYYEYAKDGFGNRPQEEYYEKVFAMTHGQSHEFPTQQPRSKQIYDKVCSEIWRYCGAKPVV